MKKLMKERLAVSRHNPIRARHVDYQAFTFPFHFHSEYELIHIRESTGYRFVGDSVEPFGPGDLILLGPNLPHCMKSAPEFENGTARERVKAAIVQFEEDFLSHGLSHYPQFVSVKKLLEDSRLGVYFRSPAREITDLIDRIPRDTGFPQILDLLTLLHRLSGTSRKRFIASRSYFDSIPEFPEGRIGKILAYLSNNYTKELTIKEAASVGAMNPSAFCRYFREKTGRTFKQYVLEMRIGYACKLLGLGRMNIGEVGMECGFNSSIHFNRVFRKFTGMSPTEYRNRI